MNAQDHSRVAEIARGMWEDEGRPCGRDKEHWEKAEKRLSAERVLERTRNRLSGGLN